MSASFPSDPASFSPSSTSSPMHSRTARLILVPLCLLASYGFSQHSTTSNSPEVPAAEQPPAIPAAPEVITLPTGTGIALELTHPIQSRLIHRGDDIYAQIVSAVTAGDQVVIPQGTLVQGKVERLGRNGSRGQIYLKSLSVIFDDGHVVSVPGPIMMQSDQGYALKDPGNARIAAFVALPVAGAGIGALAGHAAASSTGTTITNSLPAGCSGPPPGCLTSSLTGPPDKGKDTVIGAAIGGGVGLAASLIVLGTSHHFFLAVGAPVEMVLPRPVVLPEDQVSQAIRDAQAEIAAEDANQPSPPPAPAEAPAK